MKDKKYKQTMRVTAFALVCAVPCVASRSIQALSHMPYPMIDVSLVAGSLSSEIDLPFPVFTRDFYMHGRIAENSGSEPIHTKALTLIVPQTLFAL
jgi:hypothetical protein